MAGLFDSMDPQIASLLNAAGSGLSGGAGRALPSGKFGLLDFLQTDDAKLGIALLGAAAPSTRPTNFAGRLAQGFGSYQAMKDDEQKRALNQANLLKGGIELSEMQRKLKDDADGRDVLQNYHRNRGAVGGGQGAPNLEAPGFNAGGAGANGGGSGGSAGGNPGGPGYSRAAFFEQYTQLADAFAAKGLAGKAQQYYELAEKYRPKYSTTPQFMVGPGGKLVPVLVGEDGTTQELGYGPKPDITIEDLGGTKRVLDRNNLRGGEVLAKTMTPGEVASDRIARGNLGVAQGNLRVAQDRFNLDANSPAYMQTDGGIVALPKRPQPGAQLIGQPVQGPDGSALGPPLKAIPPSANTAIVSNLQNLNRARSALALLDGQELGTAKGDPDATGWKGYLPNDALNRIDPRGVDTRAAIADLGSMVIHERSGAAVTASESPRLKPFIPLATDDRATAKKKLERFVSIYQAETDALGESTARGRVTSRTRHLSAASPATSRPRRSRRPSRSPRCSTRAT
ncbi:MAG: hypothetical protein H0X13_16330 [Ramlibacter sp.]|nr:hypothetical protein [Ramlibacter sp.]